MKITELLESTSPVAKSAIGAIPGLTSWAAIDNDYYKAMRFGMMIAGAPDFEVDHNHEGPFGQNFTTVSYSKGEEEKLEAASLKMGITGSKLSNPRSKETDDVGKYSPVSNWNKQNS